MQNYIEYIDDVDVQEILDQRAFEDFWRERYSKPVKPLCQFSCEDKKWVRSAIKELDKLSQFILHLRYWENLLPKEISLFIRLSPKSNEK